MKTLVLILLTTCSVLGFTQKPKEYFQRINENYAGLSSMQMMLNYKLYRGTNSNDIVDEYFNTICISENTSYRKVYTDEIIRRDDLTIVLDHEFKTIQLINSVANEMSVIDDQQLKQNLKNCKDIRIREKEQSIEIGLVFQDGLSLPFGKAVVTVDKNYWIQKIVFYYNIQLNFSQDSFNPDYGQPRLEIDYTDLKKKWKDKEGITQIDKYLTLEDGVYKPTDLYKGYEIIDIRN